MKKLILIITSLVTSTGVFSQPFGDATGAFWLEKLNYENSSGEKGTTYFKYDKNNNLIKSFWTLNDKSRYSVNYYDYDSLGNKVSEFFYRSDSVSGFATHVYNGSRLVQSELKKHKGWLNGLINYQYDDHNRKVSGNLEKNGNIICQVSYDYDSKGNLSREYWDFNGKWNQTFKYLYKKKNSGKHYYSSPFLTCENNYRISKEDYTFNNEIGGPSIYNYTNGLLTQKTFIRSDSVSTNTFYEYDKTGKLISSRRIYSDSSTAYFTYDYDENDNLVTRKFYRADTLYGFESYLYNSDNELTKAYLKNFDSWLTGTLFFTTDATGKISEGKFVGQNGFNATVSYMYNPDDLLSEITWNFSFGKFQRYVFEYEPAD